MTGDSVEKAWERRACRRLGVERRGNTGHGGSDDDGSAAFAVEAFMRSVPALPGNKLDQARRQGKETGRPWLLAQQVRGRPLALATCEFEAFAQLYDTAVLAVRLAVTFSMEDLAALSEAGLDGVANQIMQLQTLLAETSG